MGGTGLIRGPLRDRIYIYLYVLERIAFSLLEYEITGGNVS